MKSIAPFRWWWIPGLVFRGVAMLVALTLATLAADVPSSMSLEEIESALRQHPPGWNDGAARGAILAALDQQVTVQIRTGWTDEEKARVRLLHDFYLRRMDEALAVLEQTRVTTGVHVFKFYSSSFVYRTAQGTVAVDFCQGPINNADEPERVDQYGSGFYLRPDQRDRLARQIDVSLITHRHHDHADYSLARRMVAQGKPVIGPAQLKAQWRALADGLTVPTYGSAQKFGSVEIFTMLGAQYATSEPTGVGTERRGIPTLANPAADSETVVYLFRLGGITFLTGAENHVPGQAWLREGMRLGFTPRVRLALGQYQGERDLVAVLNTLPPIFRLPLHEYELLHDNGGNRLGPLLQGRNLAEYEARRLMPLVWGENFLLSGDTVGVLDPASAPRLVNLSTLGTVEPGQATVTVGFTLAGTTLARVLIRAVGPALAGFGVASPLADPRLAVLRPGASAPLLQNDNWGLAANAAEIGRAAADAGAFALPAGSADSALLATLEPGAYTAQVTGAAGAAGEVLVEVYQLP
jgi:L-ascorbate metabolism protein UlaG (beta-lactamase superfamily)